MNKLIVALGNPGKKYELTRHNVAWQVLTRLDFYADLIWKDMFQGAYSNYSKKDNFTFLMPLTYMNLSGISVRDCMNFFKITSLDVLVVHDEVDIPYGVCVFKKGGGLAGHNGLKSIAEKTGTRDFLRLRVGIGRSENKAVKDHVLSAFSTQEMQTLDIYLKKVAEAIVSYMENGYEKTAGNFNRKNLIEG